LEEDKIEIVRGLTVKNSRNLEELKKVLCELFQRMGDFEDLSIVGYDLLAKLKAKK